MKIACLQFAPQAGDVDHNLNRADAVLSRGDTANLDLLVLPEMAFSGTGFLTLSEITPFFEPSCAGITSLWARTTALKYGCLVAVGYPEGARVSSAVDSRSPAYSSIIAVNSEGETISNYKRSYLTNVFEEGHGGALCDNIGRLTMGIGTDLSSSPSDLSFCILRTGANLVILSMAWKTAENASHFSCAPEQPDIEALTCWIKMLDPLLRSDDGKETIVVCANRTGSEGDIVYAGTSAVIGVKEGEVRIYGVLGRSEKRLLVVDTDLPPYAKIIEEFEETLGLGRRQPRFLPKLNIPSDASKKSRTRALTPYPAMAAPLVATGNFSHGPTTELMTSTTVFEDLSSVSSTPFSFSKADWCRGTD